MPRKLLIVGNGEIASMAFEYFSHDSEYEVAGFAIDPEFIKSDTFEGLPLLPFEEARRALPPAQADAFVAIGDAQLNRIRAKQYERTKAAGYKMATYVSSRAFVWRSAQIGENCFILEDNTIQAFVSIGDNVILWSGNHIGHRSVIESHCFITSHVVISGFCKVGAYSYMGVNSSVANTVEIARDNYITIGSVVTASTEENQIYQGNPAEPRKVSAKRFCRVREEAP